MRIHGAYVGIALVIVGVLINAAAGIRYARMGRAIERGEEPKVSLGMASALAAAMAVGGVILAILLALALA